jgi:hypothetical protein
MASPLKGGALHTSSYCTAALKILHEHAEKSILPFVPPPSRGFSLLSLLTPLSAISTLAAAAQQRIPPCDLTKIKLCHLKRANILQSEDILSLR